MRAGLERRAFLAYALLFIENVQVSVTRVVQPGSKAKLSQGVIKGIKSPIYYCNLCSKKVADHVKLSP